MLELKFAIYYRAASLPSQASYAVVAEESQAFFKRSPHTNCISNSAILRNNYILLLSSKFIIALFRMIYIRTNNKEGNTLTDSHIQEQQMHSYRVLSATSTKGATHPTVI